MSFVTGLEVGNSAVLQLVASASAFVNAWIDFDGNGVFGADEKILDSEPVTQGSNTIAYDVPAWADATSTWARFRISSTAELGPTGGGCGSKIQMRFSMTLPMTDAIPTQQMPTFPYDPFLFATDDYDHSLAFGLPPGRAYEIHLPNKAPTEAFRDDFFGRREDRSEPENGRYFVSQNGMPWAINVGVELQYSLEYMDIIYAYPLFPSFIANEGQIDADWYILENGNTKNIFSD